VVKHDRYPRFNTVPVLARKAIGAYATENDFGRVIGADWKLDKHQAEQLTAELNAAFERGVEWGEMVKAA
jgi:hypothetical protein